MDHVMIKIIYKQTMHTFIPLFVGSHTSHGRSSAYRVMDYMARSSFVMIFKQWERRACVSEVGMRSGNNR